uniref:Uncharacterized protein n=1 Tax=Vespula pensylvanica TaxID=30213 RepID=A0A834NKB4_VESPE|nr:hypothetical protein H0235_013566 [Vespula pensylvanica]
MWKRGFAGCYHDAGARGSLLMMHRRSYCYSVDRRLYRGLGHRGLCKFVESNRPVCTTIFVVQQQRFSFDEEVGGEVVVEEEDEDEEEEEVEEEVKEEEVEEVEVEEEEIEGE